MIRSLDLDSRATDVDRFDMISAFDLMSRAAMLDGLSNVRRGVSVLPFVLWGHNMGLESIQIFATQCAHLFTCCLFPNASPIFKIAQALEEHTRIQVRLGITRFSSAKIRRFADRFRASRPERQGVARPRVYVEFVETQLQATTEKHSVLCERILHVQDLRLMLLLRGRPSHGHSRWPTPAEGHEDSVAFEKIHGLFTPCVGPRRGSRAPFPREPTGKSPLPRPVRF